jgi:hypothetical protein
MSKKRYREMIDGNPTEMMGKIYIPIIDGEPLTLQDIIKKEMPDLRHELFLILCHYDDGSWSKGAIADAIIALIEKGSGE